MNYAMRMMERDGLIRTLAEPNSPLCRARQPNSWQAASIRSRLSTLLASSRHLQGVWRRRCLHAGRLSEGRISLKIETEVSELTDVGGVTLSSISIPALKKRQAKSTVELPSGGTLALAGLLSEDTRKNIDGFPASRTCRTRPLFPLKRLHQERDRVGHPRDPLHGEAGGSPEACQAR